MCRVVLGGVFMKSSFSASLLLFVLFTGRVFSAETFTLDTAKAKVVDENISVSIAYEKYVMAQNQARSKTLQLLPSFSIDILLFDYQYLVLRSIIPEPQRFFDAAASKDLAEAASINRTIVKKNLLEDLEKNYFLHQYHGEMVSTLAKELEIRNQIAERTQEAYDLGAVDFTEYYSTQRDVINSKTQLVNGKELLKSEEFALKLILQVNNVEALDLEDAAFYNETIGFPVDVQDAMTIAIDNSKEVDQFSFLIKAAEKTKRGVAISWISWGGVGFDYFARVSIAKAEVRKIEHERTKTVYETRNQIAALYETIGKHKEKMGLQAQLLEMAEVEYARALSNYDDLLGTFIQVKKAELNLLVAKREQRRLQYELELKFIQLKRVIGAYMITNEIPRA